MLALIGIVAISGIAFVVVTWRLFVRPADVLHWPDQPEQADAVVMYGGAGLRFLAATDLAERGVAETLLISDPLDPDPNQPWTAYKAFCLYDHSYEAICFDPQPRTTRGESRYFANTALVRNWDRIVAVTTTDQATRARLLLGRCYPGELEVYTVPTTRPRLLAIGYEWAALLRALTVRRGC